MSSLILPIFLPLELRIFKPYSSFWKTLYTLSGQQRQPHGAATWWGGGRMGAGSSPTFLGRTTLPALCEGCPVWLGGKAMKPKPLASSPLPAHSSHPKAAKGHDHCVSAKEEAGHGLRNRGRKQKRKTRPGRLPGLPQAIAKHCRMNHHVLFVSEEH